MKTNQLKKMIVCLMVILSLTHATNAQINFYVSPTGDDNNAGSLAAPFKTIQKARDVIRVHPNKATSNYEVMLRGGSYPITLAISFNASDGGVGTNTVTYKNYEGEVPVITGGQTVTGWTQVPGKLYWEAPVTYNSFRQLYVGGKRKQRARSRSLLGVNDIENGVVPTSISGYTVDTADAKVFQNVLDVEIHQQIEWSDGFFPVTAMSQAGNKVTITAPRLNELFFIGLNSYTPFYIENAIELLDQPGEWYCDKTTNIVYYYPEVGQNLATTSAIIPVGEEFLRIIGSNATPINNLNFSGITFEHAGWVAPNRQGWINLQANVTYRPSNGQAKSAIYTEHTDSLSFRGCTFRHIAAVGLDLRNGSQYSKIVGNRFYDIGDAAISVSSPQHNFIDLPTEKGNDYVTIENNAIYATGRENRGSVAIIAFYVTGIKIEHNQIYDVPYSGISVGWGWNGQPTSTTSKQNITRYNRIGFFMNQMKDGGGFYSLGQQPSSTCSNNYFYNGAYDQAIYYDQGSQGSTCNNNVISGIPNWLKINGPASENLSFDNNYSTTTRFVLSNATTATNIITNTQYSLDGVTLPASAQPIIDFSGLEPAYMGLANIFPTAASTPAPVLSGIANSYNVRLDQTLNINSVVTKSIDATNYIAYKWRQVSGPDAITFITRTLVWNQLSFSKPGNYTVEFEMNDGFRKTVKAFNVIVSNYNFGSNRALNMPATASSNFDASLIPSRAVDNNKSTIWHPSSAQVAERSWWQVDMGTAIRLKRFELTTRQTNPQDATRKNFQIIGSNDATFGTYEAIGGLGPDSMTYLSTIVFNVVSPQPYRYYRVRKIFRQNHTIAEFVAYPLSMPEFKLTATYNVTNTLVQWNGIPEAISYVIERKSSAETAFSILTTVSNGVTSFTDATAVYSASIPYNTYRIKALDANGEYATTNEVTVYPPSLAGNTQSLAEWNFGVTTFNLAPSFVKEGVSAYETIVTPFTNADAAGSANNGVAADRAMTARNSTAGVINNNVFTFKLKADTGKVINVSGLSLDVRVVTTGTGFTSTWLPYDVKWGTDGINYSNATTMAAYNTTLGNAYQNRQPLFTTWPINVTSDIYFQVTVNGTTNASVANAVYGMDNVRVLGTVGTLNVLPIRLLNFHALQDGSKVKVQWTTSFEVNNDRYEILKSSDNINYTLLSTVMSKNAERGSSYQVMDANPLSGYNYYKLIQYDKDGERTDVGTRLVNIKPLVQGISVYPNPSKGSFNIAFPMAGKYTVALSDLSGKQLVQKTLRSTGNSVHSFNTANVVPAGQYILKITDLSSSETIVKKVNIVKE